MQEFLIALAIVAGYIFAMGVTQVFLTRFAGFSDGMAESNAFVWPFWLLVGIIMSIYCSGRRVGDFTIWAIWGWAK